MCENFAPNFGDKITDYCITKIYHTSSFTREFFTKNNMTVVPHTSYSPDLAPCDFSVSCHFDTIQVIEAESQAVLDTLTEHDFQDAFGNIAEDLATVHTREMGLF
jgi:hypothetical protein